MTLIHQPFPLYHPGLVAGRLRFHTLLNLCQAVYHSRPTWVSNKLALSLRISHNYLQPSTHHHVALLEEATLHLERLVLCMVSVDIS